MQLDERRDANDSPDRSGLALDDVRRLEGERLGRVTKGANGVAESGESVRLHELLDEGEVGQMGVVKPEAVGRTVEHSVEGAELVPKWAGRQDRDIDSGDGRRYHPISVVASGRDKRAGRCFVALGCLSRSRCRLDALRLEVQLEEGPDSVPRIPLGLAVHASIPILRVDAPVEAVTVPELVDRWVMVDARLGEVRLVVLERVDELLRFLEVNVLVVVGRVYQQRSLKLVDMEQR